MTMKLKVLMIMMQKGRVIGIMSPIITEMAVMMRTIIRSKGFSDKYYDSDNGEVSDGDGGSNDNDDSDKHYDSDNDHITDDDDGKDSNDDSDKHYDSDDDNITDDDDGKDSTGKYDNDDGDDIFKITATVSKFNLQ